MSSAPTHLDLFSGIGGFAIAAQSAGFRTIGFSEIEPYACRVLARHWFDVPNYGDITKFAGIECDLITGGFPCQPFSCAGKRRGTADHRHLWPEMLRVVAASRPAWVCAENVPGIISMELDRVCADLEGAGYAVWPLVIPACAVDAPHRRDRVWIVAHSERRDCGQRSAERNRETEPRSHDELARPGGNVGTVADTTGHKEHKRERRGVDQKTGRGESMHTTAISCGEDVADARRGHGEGPGRSIRGSTVPARWQPEPAILRVAHGIPNRSHRLRALGNAIVPQVAQVILTAIRRELA